MSITKEQLARTTAKFTWDFANSFHLETSFGNFEWSDPDYPESDNTIVPCESYGKWIKTKGIEYGRDKGRHTIGQYCGDEFILFSSRAVASWRRHQVNIQNDLEQFSKRVQILLAYEWAKSVLHTLKGNYYYRFSRKALETAWNWIKNPTQDNAKKAELAARCGTTTIGNLVAAAVTNKNPDAEDVSYIAHAVACTENPLLENKWEWVHKTYLDAKGPSFPFQNTWKTTDTISLAKTIWQDQDLSLMKILADALQDAGMQDETLLKHLQKDECTLADWTLTNLVFDLQN